MNLRWFPPTADGEASGVAPPALTQDFRFDLDPAARWTDGGRALCGGDPLRLFRFSARGAQAVRLLAEGRSIADARDEARTDPTALAQRLVDAGVLHPCPEAGPYTLADVTVVIPVRDRAKVLARLLARLSSGTVGGASGVRVVVVDDGSTDGSGEAAAAAGADVIRRSSSSGPAAARNMGLRQVSTPVVAFIDSDCVPEPDWLEGLLPQFADQQVAAVTPRIHGGATDRAGAVPRYDSVASALDLGPRAAAVRAGTRVAYVPAAVLVARREALTDLGGFDERLPTGEDVDLVWRLADAGWTVRYVPSVVVAHEARSELAAMLRRRFAYGTSAAPLARRHPGRLAPVRAPGWSLAAWAPLAVRRVPLSFRVPASAGILTVAAGSLATRLGLQERRNEAGLVVALMMRAHLRTLRSIAEGTLRPYAPLAVAVGIRRRTARRAVIAAAVVRIGTEWWPRRHQIGPAAFGAMRLADDFAYSAGVWWGCIVHRTIEPLVPQVSWGTARP